MEIATINPATGKLLKAFDALSDSQVDAKIRLAAEAFPKFRALAFRERPQMVRRSR